MTSGNFTLIPINSITKGDRQRKELKNVPILANSISRLGLIHPVVITRDLALVAGERRLEACRSLGHETIAAQFAEDLSDSMLQAIELEENVKRENISWPDECRAIARYHSHRSQEPGWSESKTADALGVSQPYINERLQVAKELEKLAIAAAPKFSVARGIVARAESRKQANILAEIMSEDAPAEPTDSPILTADFNEWAVDYSGPKFNFIHCDFPYGINAQDRQQGTSVEKHGAYNDSPDTYWTLCETFSSNCLRFSADSCHLIFWFSMSLYEETFKFLQEETPFEIDPFPLVWHKSDNVGLLPDPQRGPRRTYETAFFGRRGDRKIVKAVANSFSGATVRSDHMSVKPGGMLDHFFRMVVDENTTLLDPTCGSGRALRAARDLRAKDVLGLEINPEFAERARELLREEPRLI